MIKSALRAARRQLGVARAEILCALHRRTLTLEAPGPLVSFTFDDFPRTAFTEGGPILQSRGFRGTYYVAMGLMNTSNHLGAHFRIEDLEAVTREGHEIASHTFSHSSGRRLTLDAFLKDVQRGSTAIREAGFACSGNFAYPYGEATFASKPAVGREAPSCRGTIPGINGRQADLNLLRANYLYGDLDQLAAAQKLILENERRQGWLIFYTHDVRRNPSPYGCTPELLERVVGLVEKRNMSVMTVAEVLAGQARSADAKMAGAARE